MPIVTKDGYRAPKATELKLRAMLQYIKERWETDSQYSEFKYTQERFDKAGPHTGWPYQPTILITAYDLGNRNKHLTEDIRAQTVSAMIKRYRDWFTQEIDLMGIGVVYQTNNTLALSRGLYCKQCHQRYGSLLKDPFCSETCETDYNQELNFAADVLK